MTTIPIDADAFARDGFVCGPRILTEAQCAQLRTDLDRVIDQRGRADVRQPGGIADIGQAGQPVWQIVNIHLASPAFAALLRLPGLAATAGALLDEDAVWLWHDQIQYKPAGHGGYNHWHQDWPYWQGMPAPVALTAWIAIDDADEGNGCMNMVPGSHRWGKAIDHLHQVGGAGALPERYGEHAVTVRSCPVPAGAVHFHHDLTWHSSPANTSARPRRAIALHLMGSRAFVGADGRRAEPKPHQPLLWRAGDDIAAIAACLPAAAHG